MRRELSEHDRKILAPKSKAVRGWKAEKERTAWGKKHLFCFACGAGEYGLHVLTTHEIIGGAGGRSFEACNFIRLGMSPCHELATMLDVRGPRRRVYDVEFGHIDAPGLLLPKLPIGVCLTLKLMHDPDEYDAERLERLRGSRLPDPEEVPAWFARQYEANMKRRGGAG